MNKIKFGTDGWRAIIAQNYTVDNVARVSVATAKWVKQNFQDPTPILNRTFFKTFNFRKDSGLNFKSLFLENIRFFLQIKIQNPNYD